MWVEVGSFLSAVGLYEAQLSACAFQLLGMADQGLLPRVLAVRSSWFGTPWLAILGSTTITLAVSVVRFDNVVASANFLYGLSMLLEFSAFLWLRRKRPLLKRPFRVPLNFAWLVVMCLVPSGFIIIVMAMEKWQVYAISGGLTALGVALHYWIGFIKQRKWMEFNKVESNPGTEHPMEGKLVGRV